MTTKNRQEQRQQKKQIPGGNDRKKGNGKGFDAKGAKVAKFRHADRARKKLLVDNYCGEVEFVWVRGGG
jgi:hypothetical protein